ncbi:MAG: thiamine diphosphokinase [Lachnospiraceae bacterium]|nr:thiamine diphosphokinase [Lachnospiraceae bacterium]
MKHCLMISGGPLDLSFAKEFIKDRHYDLIVAVDAGFAACLELGIHPDLLVGDFDTFGREKIQDYLDDPAFQIDIHQPEKDETDTELAFRDILKAGCTSVDALGALGGRIDHEISNIHLLVHEKKRGLSVNYFDARNKIFVLDAEIEKEHRFRKEEIYGKYVSFLPITEKVKGITLKGFKYPLDNKDISILENPSLCVSNEVEAEQADMSFEDGILICIESRD